ncbi:DMT family transporter [Aestuariivirga sp.]|uniref:DMT family transporter n=1 Tax=Aestuariivirga sp. TaxID=2650926 RepID=UPI0039E2C3E7
MTAKEQSYAQGVIYVLIAELGWSLSGFFVRLMPGMDGWQFNTWRGYWMGVALLCYLIAIYGWDVFRKFGELPLIALIASASFFTLGSTLYVTSLTLVSTATISVIGASSPIFTGLLSPWITGEKPGLEAWAAAALAMIGVGIIAWDGLSGGHLIGIIVSCCVPISFAGQTLTLRRYRGYDMVPAICVGGFACFVVAGAFGFLAGHAGGGFDVPPRNVALLVAMGTLQLAIPGIYYAKGAKSVSAVTLALIVMLDAVLNPLWPWLAFGELPGRAAFIGGAIIVGAVMISIFGGRLLNRGPRTA